LKLISQVTVNALELDLNLECEGFEKVGHVKDLAHVHTPILYGPNPNRNLTVSGTKVEAKILKGKFLGGLGPRI
jgi:hypothetical protein